LIGLAIAAANAQAAPSRDAWTIRLLNDAAALSALEPLRLRLSRDTPQQRHAALLFQLDDVDITDRVTLTGEIASYLPARPLEPGTHVLRLVHAPPLGRWRELGVWRLTIPAAGDRDAAAKDLLATLRAGPVQARVGPQRLSYDSLIHQDIDRRGAVAAWDLRRQVRIRGFGVQSRADSGYKRLLGSDAADYQLNGILLEHGLEANDGNQVDVAVGWVSGNARVGDADARGGSAWSVAGRAAMMSDRLHLQAEYAGSRFDWDTPSAAEQRLRDAAGDAYQVGVEYRAAESSPIAWRVGSEFSEVDPWFGSLGNPTVHADRRHLRAYGGATFGEWQLDLALDRRRDNLRQDPSRPIGIADDLQLATVWSPPTPNAIEAIGRPSYRLSAGLGRDRQLATSDATLDRRSPRPAIDLALQGEFAHSDWLWGVRAKGGFAPGPIDAPHDAAVRLFALDLYGDFSGGSAPPVKPSLSWQRRRDVVAETVDDRWRAGLSLPAIDWRHDLQGSLDLALEHRDHPDRANDGIAADVRADLVWTLRRPASNRNGLALAVSGSLVTTQPESTGDDAGYALMVSLSTGDPLGAWQ
jgi:hypothetical protein